MKKLKVTPEVLLELMNTKYTELLGQTPLPTSVTMSINPSVSLTKENKIQVLFKKAAYKKMLALIDKSAKEIGWHGFVDRVSPTRYEISDLIVFPQKVTGSTVTPDETEYTQWTIKVATENMEGFNKMRFHGHSHVNMAVSPSKVDTDYQQNMIQNIPDFYIFGIFNKSGSWWMNIFDIENNTLYEKDDIEYLYEPEEESTWASDMIKEYVAEEVKVTPINSYGGSSYGNGYGSGAYGGSTYGSGGSYAPGKRWSEKLHRWVYPYEEKEVQKQEAAIDGDYDDDDEELMGWYGYHNQKGKNKSRQYDGKTGKKNTQIKGWKGVNYYD